MSTRRCPNCKSHLPVDHGVKFDGKNNVICPKCNKPIIATTSESEEEITEKTKTPTKPTYGPNYGPNYSAHLGYNHLPLGTPSASAKPPTTPWRSPDAQWYEDQCQKKEEENIADCYI